MDRPSLRLTDAAKSELTAIMCKITDYRAIASVLWAESGGSSKPRPDGSYERVDLGPHWGVGFYSPSKVPADEVTEIDGIPFIFVQGKISMRLNDATLDYVGGKFVVEERAI